MDAFLQTSFALCLAFEGLPWLQQAMGTEELVLRAKEWVVSCRGRLVMAGAFVYQSSASFVICLMRILMFRLSKLQDIKYLDSRPYRIGFSRGSVAWVV